MELSVAFDDGEPVTISCANTWTSRWVCEEIIAGKTYPNLPFVDDVQVIFDVGANCGATSVYLGHHHPSATVHAFEPGAEARSHLERNATRNPGIRVHPIGLHDRDDLVPLYQGEDDTITASVIRREVNVEAHETVQLRAAGPWAEANGIDRIDILKLDVEGCEVEVLESLAALIPTMKVVYVEYDSRVARRRIEELLAATHELYFAMLMVLDQGEAIFVRKDLADLPAVRVHLLELFTARALR